MIQFVDRWSIRSLFMEVNLYQMIKGLATISPAKVKLFDPPQNRKEVWWKLTIPWEFTARKCEDHLNISLLWNLLQHDTEHFSIYNINLIIFVFHKRISQPNLEDHQWPWSWTLNSYNYHHSCVNVRNVQCGQIQRGSHHRQSVCSAFYELGLGRPSRLPSSPSARQVPSCSSLSGSVRIGLNL